MRYLTFMLACLPVVLFAEDADGDDAESVSNVQIDAYLAPLDGTIQSSLGLDYGMRLAANGMPNGKQNYLSFGVSNFVWQTQAEYALNDDYAIRPKIEVGVGSATSTMTNALGTVADEDVDLSLLDVNEQTSLNGISLKLRQYILHFISKRHGIFSVGRSETFDRAATDFLALGSGVNNKFYQTASGVRIYNKDNQTFMGRFTNGTGKLQSAAGEDGYGGSGLRLWGINRYDELYDGVAYTLPYKDWLLQVAYSNVPGDFTDKYYQVGMRYTYDALWARLSLLGSFASSWPSACQVSSYLNMSEMSAGWANCQYTGIDASSPYSQMTFGSKLSLGYVDASISYRSLFDTDSDASTVGLASRVHDYYAGLDYTFMDATEFGPLSLGLGFIKQNKFASMVGQAANAYVNSTATTAPIGVNDSKSYGLILSMNQKLGHNAGVRLFWEQFGFSAIAQDNALKIKASPVRLAVLSFYTNIEQSYTDKR